MFSLSTAPRNAYYSLLSCMGCKLYVGDDAHFKRDLRIVHEGCQKSGDVAANMSNLALLLPSHNLHRIFVVSEVFATRVMF